MKEYKYKENSSLLNEPQPYYGMDDNTVYSYVSSIKKGISYKQFSGLSSRVPFSQQEWAGILHLTDRTLLRYKTEKKSFEPLQSERILQINLLFNYGYSVFEEEEYFHKWLKEKNLALGGIKPIELLDNSFGIDLIKSTLGRIEHGIMA